VFGEQTIESLMHSSYAELAATTMVTRRLPITAERFTRQCLACYLADRPGRRCQWR